MNINGTFANPGTLSIEIGGTGGAGVNPNGHDQLLITGVATLGGTLDVTLTNGFTPANGNSFVVLDAASSTGTFATVNLPNIAPNVWSTTYNDAAGTVTLSVSNPTAAGVSVSGRVLTANGIGIRGAIVVITDSAGVSRSVNTSSFGYYRFDDVQAGATYVVSVRGKQYVFASRIVSVGDDLTDVDFTAQQNK